MKILNLTNLEKSEIKFEISKFPDGQQQVTINKMSAGYIKGLLIDATFRGGIQIKSRLNNFKDLELICCAVASLRELGMKEIHLYTPYFLGSRSDRKFEEGSNNYLKNIICPIINSLGFKSVTVLDPHSDVLEACLNNFKKEDNVPVVVRSLFSIKDGIYPGRINKPETLDEFILMSPDAGANKKIFKVADEIGYKGSIITCSKSRDEHGKLTRVSIPLTEDDGSGYTMQYIDNCNHKDLIIIDDICDGGATFINIAKELKAQKCKGKIYLIITHGIFSKGFKELNEYFDGIYCTNSYVDMEDNNFSLVNDKHLHKLKQLNVF